MENSSPVYPTVFSQNSPTPYHHLSQDPPQQLSSQTINMDDMVDSETPLAWSNHNHTAIPKWKDEEKGSLRNSKSSRRYCYCFHSRGGCVASAITILILLGIAIFFLFPRIPSFAIGEPFVNSLDSLRFNVSDDQTVTAMSYDIAINFTVDSQNYFDFYTSEIIVTGNLMNQKSEIINNTYGYGKLEGVNFPALKATNATLPLTLYWVSIGLDANADPAVVEIQSCTTANPPKTFHIAYRVKVSLPLVSWTGWSLSTSGIIQFNISNTTQSERDQINSVINTIISTLNGGSAVG